MSVASGGSHKAPGKAKASILPVLMSVSKQRGQPLPLGPSSRGGSSHCRGLCRRCWGLCKCWLLEETTEGVQQGCTSATHLQRHCLFVTSPGFISRISSQYCCLRLTFFCGEHFLFSSVFLIFFPFPSGPFCGKIETPSRMCCFDRREITLFFFPGGSSTVQIGEILPLPGISALLEEKPGSHSLATGKMRVLVLDSKTITGCICLQDMRK